MISRKKLNDLRAMLISGVALARPQAYRMPRFDKQSFCSRLLNLRRGRS